MPIFSEILFYANLVAVAAGTLFTLSFVVSCLYEKERRAAVVSGLISCGLIGVLVALHLLDSAGFLHTRGGAFLLAAGLVLVVVGALFVTRRTRTNVKALRGSTDYIEGEVKRFDERHTVFARHRLQPGTERYEDFYRKHPDWEAVDAKTRDLSPKMVFYGQIDRPNEKPNLAVRASSSHMTDCLSTSSATVPVPAVHLRDERIELSPEENTLRVKGLATHLGAKLVGITKLNPLWVYSHRGTLRDGKEDSWGSLVEETHPYGIVIGTEMTWDMIRAAPHQPSSLESGIQYAATAFISVHLTAFITNLGYSAESNHSGHYNVNVVPMAVDAGLGELSRMGYLLTKELGPRVRLAAVTTDLPLIPDKPVDIGVEDFCTICKKCAVTCPSNAIPHDDDKTVAGGIRRWKLDAESCYEYWWKVGTGCSICMRTCPWSHPKTFPHRVITELTTRNRWARRVFSPLDDLFYRSKPRPAKGPEWAKYW